MQFRIEKEHTTNTDVTLCDLTTGLKPVRYAFSFAYVGLGVRAGEYGIWVLRT